MNIYDKGLAIACLALAFFLGTVLGIDIAESSLQLHSLDNSIPSTFQLDSCKQTKLPTRVNKYVCSDGVEITVQF
jgi:hypothetical protein